MTITKGINRLGLAVKDLDATTAFFVECLGWTESGRDNSYPRTAVSDGSVRLTLWQLEQSRDVQEFDRRKNAGLHHIAFEIESEAALNDLAQSVSRYLSVNIEFMPELVGGGPRKHMMCSEPSGLRVEFIWPGE